MFRGTFSFRRKSSDEGRTSRFRQSESHSQSPNSSPLGLPREDSTTHAGIAGQHQEHATSALLKPPNEDDDTSTSRGRSRRNSEVDPGPLGLSVVYTPEHGHKVDIVFIHGLGGTSRMTWSKDKDPERFWPLKFLSVEPDIREARILTFGYNANFLKASSVSSSVLDFAKDLLFNLKYAKDEQRSGLNISRVPLIFVVHSMGGLIIKEAYIQGQNDPEYESIVRAISAITFLATPHRGTNLAEVLKRILQSSIIISSKRYISELARNSFTLQKLNEQFRHIAPRLDIVSFYETRPTPIAPRMPTVMILEQDSSVLGYPGEVSEGLDADHHDVCKYDSPKDPNYILVRNVLASLVGKIVASDPSGDVPGSSRRESLDLKSVLGIAELPDIDYIFFRDQWAQGTCDWIFQEESFIQWLHPTNQISHLLWLNGGPATGKSVLSSFIVNSLMEKRLCCQYFFIRFADEKKRNLSFLLRSIAYQLARDVPAFMKKILDLASEAIDFGSADPRTIWERVFKSILFKMNGLQPVYWVIDGLDEAYDPRAVIRQLSDIPTSSVPLRILLVSRKTSEISAAFQKVPTFLSQSSINVESHGNDLCCYVRQELNMAGDAEYRESIVQRILASAQNNFLWVRLAIDQLNLCHRQANVELVLQQLPVGMEAVYDRMALSIAQSPSADRALAAAILQCVCCSLRVLTVAEMSQALDEDASDILDFQRSVVDLCGGFVVVDNGGNVSLIHQTAREYLLSRTERPLHIDRVAAHTQMFLSCMKSLMAIGLRSKIQGSQVPDFLEYAASFWSSHLSGIIADTGPSFEALTKFLTGPWVLTWINFLATRKRLKILIRASRDLSRYSAKQKEYHATQNEQDMSTVKVELIESWATDFVKVVGKFGTILRRNPEAIYRLIPPFCPRNSSIYQSFGKVESRSLTISGLTTENWDDSLARLSLPFGTYGSHISAAGASIAILASPGNVFVYDSSTFEEISASPIKHNERVYRMELNGAGTLLVTHGYRTTKLWEVSTGKCKLSVANLESRPRPLCMLLTNQNTRLLVGTEDRRLRSLDLMHPSPTWQVVAELDEPELDGHFLNSSSYMALNKDGTLIAVAYRGHPLSAWEVDGPVHIGHCWRKQDELVRGQVIQAVWHPHYAEVLGLYIEGVVFRWRPYENEVEEIGVGASRLAISSDGNLFATGDVRGKVKVFTTSDFELVYQLASEESIFGLVFSPDQRRFYDIRGPFGNAWEPNALIRFAEQRDRGLDNRSESESLAQSSTASLSSSARIDSITALAASPTGRIYACGTDKGTVRLCEAKRGKLSNIYSSKSLFSIEQLEWSSDGRHLCFSDSGRRVVVMSVTPNSNPSDPAMEIKTEIQIKDSTNGPISQLLFHPDGHQLSVHSSSTIHVISLDSGSITRSWGPSMTHCKWIIHPREPTLIVGFGMCTVHVLDWTLTERQTYKIDFSVPEPVLQNPETTLCQASVDRVLVTHDKKRVLVQISQGRNSRHKTLFYLPSTSISPSNAATLEVSQPDGPLPIDVNMLPEVLASNIAASLLFLPHDRLVFLSKTFSVCILRISFSVHRQLSATPSTIPSGDQGLVKRSSTSGSNYQQPNGNISVNPSGEMIKSLFWLPGDWIGQDCVSLCMIWSVEKSFMCPRNGEVAIVRCAALA